MQTNSILKECNEEWKNDEKKGEELYLILRKTENIYLMKKSGNEEGRNSI
jgi:hypothetical protein